jgi:adenine phosphoribosyltransferase
MLNERLLQHIRTIPDVPKKGIMFRDITPLLANPEGFEATIAAIVDAAKVFKPTKVIGVEARGFILAAPVALRLGAGFVPVRKPGKLPWHVVDESYSLEYGNDRLEMHTDAVGLGDTVLIVDDVLATGGTAAATVRLVEQCAATVAGLVFLIELDGLSGRSALGGYAVESILTL